ncbi:MAG TPA: hypothetical protein VG034_02090 [Acidimicrobiia bacterium]|jgi:hypothetical protein|nr:hypothetical protein [Acidimicrobiia bacterium]
MKMISRILVLAGAAAVLLSVGLPWVTVKGALPSTLDLGLLGAEVSPLGKTVLGTETKAWPIVVAVGAVVAVLGLLGLARKLILLLGLLTTVAGGALLYYVMNVVDIETKGDTLKNTLANVALDSSAGAGPILLLAGGLAIAIGAVLD